MDADPDFRPLVLFFVQNVMSSHLLPHLNFWLPSYKFLCVFDKAYLEPGLSVGLQGGRGNFLPWGMMSKDGEHQVPKTHIGQFTPNQPSLPFQNNVWQNRQQIQQYQLWTFAYKFMFKSRLSLWHSENITNKRVDVSRKNMEMLLDNVSVLHCSNPTNK